MPSSFDDERHGGADQLLDLFVPPSTSTTRMNDDVVSPDDVTPTSSSTTIMYPTARTSMNNKSSNTPYTTNTETTKLDRRPRSTSLTDLFAPPPRNHDDESSLLLPTSTTNDHPDVDDDDDRTYRPVYNNYHHQYQYQREDDSFADGLDVSLNSTSKTPKRGGGVRPAEDSKLTKELSRWQQIRADYFQASTLAGALSKYSVVLLCAGLGGLPSHISYRLSLSIHSISTNIYNSLCPLSHCLLLG
jgi:hypothetical protein